MRYYYLKQNLDLFHSTTLNPVSLKILIIIDSLLISIVLYYMRLITLLYVFCYLLLKEIIFQLHFQHFQIKHISQNFMFLFKMMIEFISIEHYFKVLLMNQSIIFGCKILIHSFFLNHRLSSVFPCDFILKYDDDQWPTDNKLHEKLINEVKNKNIMIGGRGYFVNSFFRCYMPTNPNDIEQGIVVDHIATPFITRPYYLKLDARNKIYSLYHAEDVALSVNSWKLCNTTSIYMKLKLIQKHGDGNNKDTDKQNKLIYDKEKDIFENSYHYLINSGYIPKRWNSSKKWQSKKLNITILHKILF